MAETLYPELQRAQDMLNIVSGQRNALLNENVQLSAQVQALARENASLKAELRSMRKATPADDPNAGKECGGVVSGGNGSDMHPGA